jgi:3-dehydro-L-gulonate 2-dehydrogenase
MPAWGAKDYKLGNNPLVLAVPYKDEAIVLDFAMSQFSYGKLEVYSLAGKSLPYPGGYDEEGELTTIPGDILKTRRTLPIGYWKGSGLSLFLDILASILSGGLSTHEISRKEAEHSLSQVFIAVDLNKLHNFNSIESTIVKILTDLKESLPVDPGNEVRYPGEFIKRIREENRKNGVAVNREVWNTILAL